MLGRPKIKSHEVGLLVAIVVVLVVTVTLDSGHYYWHAPRESFLGILRQASTLGVIALGAAIVIIAGGIDLSIGSVVAASGTTLATILVLLAPEVMDPARASEAGVAGLSWTVISLAIAGALGVGFLIGTLHAWLITIVGLPPFIATLATLVGLRSLARSVVGAVTASMLGGRGTQIDVQDARFRFIAESIWIPAATFAVLAIVVWILLGATVAGRHLYALGGNEEAARLSGVRVDRVKWLAYVASALAASVAGVLHVSDFSVAEPQTLGLGDELAAIAAAVVGGCSLQGGIGTVPGVVLGVFFLRAIVDGIAKVIKTGSEVYEGLIVGMVVVVAVAVSQLRLAGGRGKQFFPGALGWASIVTLALFSGLLGAVVVGDSLLARMREAFGDAPGPVGRFLISTLGEHAGWSAMCLATVLLIAVKLSQQRSSFTPSSSAP